MANTYKLTISDALADGNYTVFATYDTTKTTAAKAFTVHFDGLAYKDWSISDDGKVVTLELDEDIVSNPADLWCPVSKILSDRTI